MPNTLKGFINIGNTCYLNAGLQLIMQNHELCDLMKNTTIKNFIDEYYNSSKPAISPNEIKDLVSKKSNIFIGFGQQDSQEFIINFLDIINEQIKIATILEDLENEIASLGIQLNKLLNLKDGMMQNLLTGKIRLI